MGRAIERAEICSSNVDFDWEDWLFKWIQFQATEEGISSSAGYYTLVKVKAIDHALWEGSQNAQDWLQAIKVADSPDSAFLFNRFPNGQS